VGVIYKITNRVNGKIYVGKTISTVGRRWTQHKDYAKHKPEIDTYLYRAMRKHGIENFSVEVVDSALLDEVLCGKECEWITKLDSANRTVGYNGTLGGQSGLLPPGAINKQIGQKRSLEARARMSAAQRGKKVSAETRAKLSAAIKGRPVSEERAAAMRANPPGLGTRRTEEQKKRMSDGIRAAWTPELRARVSAIQLKSREKSPRPGHALSAENRQKLSEATRRRWAKMTPKERSAQARKFSSISLLPENLKKRGDAIRAAWTPERRAAQAARTKEVHVRARELRGEVA